MQKKDRASHGQMTRELPVFGGRLRAYLGYVDQVPGKGDAGVWKVLPGLHVEPSFTKGRTASGQLEPGGGDGMPFSLHHEPLICGPGNTIGLWAAWARVAPGSCVQLRTGLQFSRLPAPSPGIPSPRSLLSCFVLTQSGATWVSHLFERKSWIRHQWPPWL